MKVQLPREAERLPQADVARALDAAERRGHCAASQLWREAVQHHPNIETDPWVYDGEPVIQGTRIPVSVVIGYLTLGPGRDRLLEDYPDLAGRQDAIQDAVDFTLRLLHH